jgi:2,5-diamino-6-(ribosylamino)-4(3H)-pyrimidinone 5'-phosphate reductase
MKVIMHNSISLDGCYSGFDIDLGLHYRTAGKFRPEMHLVGSETARTGAEMAGAIPDEEPHDFRKPDRRGAYFAIVDSKAACMGLLHVYRRSEFCRDVIVIVSRKTPRHYLRYLDERHYEYIISGTRKVELKDALHQLGRRFGVQTLIVDSGASLNAALLDAGLVDELSLLVTPFSIGGDALFDKVTKMPVLKLISSQKLGDYAWLRYSVIK